MQSHGIPMRPHQSRLRRRRTAPHYSLARSGRKLYRIILTVVGLSTGWISRANSGPVIDRKPACTHVSTCQVRARASPGGCEMRCALASSVRLECSSWISVHERRRLSRSWGRVLGDSRIALPMDVSGLNASAGRRVQAGVCVAYEGLRFDGVGARQSRSDLCPYVPAPLSVGRTSDCVRVCQTLVPTFLFPLLHADLHTPNSPERPCLRPGVCPRWPRSRRYYPSRWHSLPLCSTRPRSRAAMSFRERSRAIRSTR